MITESLLFFTIEIALLVVCSDFGRPIRFFYEKGLFYGNERQPETGDHSPVV